MAADAAFGCIYHLAAHVNLYKWHSEAWDAHRAEGGNAAAFITVEEVIAGECSKIYSDIMHEFKFFINASIANITLAISRHPIFTSVSFSALMPFTRTTL